MCLNRGFYSSLVLLIIAVLIPTKPASANDQLDSLLKRLEFSDKAEWPAIYMDLFVEALDNSDSAMFFADQASKYAYSNGDSLNYVRAQYAKAFLYKNDGDFYQAIELYKIALASSRNNNLIDREKAALNGLALSYYALSRFDVSLRYHFESLALREKEGDQIEIAIASNNIGLVYYQLNDYEKALVYFNRALKIEEDNGYEDTEGTYVNLGLTNLGLNRLEKAMQWFNKAIEECDTNCSISILLEAYYSKGHCLYELDRYIEAKQDFLRALKIASTNEMDSELPSIYNGFAKVLIAEKTYDEAEKYLDSSQNLAVDLRIPRDIKANYQDYAKVAFGQNDFQNAYKYQVLYDSISNQIMNEVLAKNLLQIQVDFQERENLEIIELQNKEIGRATTLLTLSIIVAFLTAMIVVILYKNNKLRKRVNEKLHDAKETIEKQNEKLTDLNTQLEERVKERTEELRASNAALVKSNHDLDNFIYKTSHDIRGPLATLQGICNIALMDITDTISVDYFQKLSKTAFKLNQILSKLLVINQINNMLPTYEKFKVAKMIDEIVEENRIEYLGKKIDVRHVGARDITLTSDAGLLKIIIGNLINNAFKFHNTSESIDSFIETEFQSDENGFIFSIADNGVGISDDVSDQIFDIFSKTSELHDTAGMGLYLVQLAIDKLKGAISVSKSEEGHTRFEVVIPNK